MKSYRIKDVKSFMARVLTMDTFDDFLLSEAKIFGKASFHLTGIAAEGFCNEEPKDESGYVPYKKLREVCLSMMRGKQTPENFTMMFLLPREETEKLIASSDCDIPKEDVEQLSFLVRFKDGELFVITGSAYRVFTMDRSLNDAWDRWVELFLQKTGIAYLDARESFTF